MSTTDTTNRHAATKQSTISFEQLDYAGGLARRKGLCLEEESIKLFGLPANRLNKIAASALINFLKTGIFTPPYYPPPKVKREGKPQNIEEEYRGYMIRVHRKNDCKYGDFRGFGCYAMKLSEEGKLMPYAGRIDVQLEFKGEGARQRAYEHIKGLIDARLEDSERSVA